MHPPARALRGTIVTFPTDDPGPPDVIRDGVVVMERGRIAAVGPAAELLAGRAAGLPLDDHAGRLLLPGFIDTHIHFPQTRVIASYGTQLLDWLQRYTFPEEARYADQAHAEAAARFFLDELARNGTTTALAYGSSHPQSIDAVMGEAERRGMRLLAGKVMMDRGAPANVLDTAERGYRETTALIERWHGRGRLEIAITPRFAITSTPEQLTAAGRLVAEHPGLVMQTHLSENLNEIATVRALYPEALDYTDVYDRFGLLGPRAVFGHGIHLSDRELARLAETGSKIAFCPTSNLFIGSGLFDLRRVRAAGVGVTLATDVGGGTSYSMLRTAAEAYKICQLNGLNWSPSEAFHMMTRGNAAGLGLADRVGSIAVGMEADIVALNPSATPAMAHRMESAGDDLDAALFVLSTLGDDRAVAATYIGGTLAA